MPSPVALSVIIPAFNEAASVTHTIGAIQAHLDRTHRTYEIIVAADGRDGTRERVRELAAGDPRISVFGDEERRGKGRAVRLGMLQARGEVVGFVDADSKTPFEEIDRFLPWFGRGFDVVIGSRAAADSRTLVVPPLYRRIGSRIFAAGMHALVGLRGIHDTQCGFKFFRGVVARDLFQRQRIDGYMFDAEVLYLAERLGHRIKEIGVAWQYDDDSRLQVVTDNSRSVVDLARIRFAHRGGRSLVPPHIRARPDALE